MELAIPAATAAKINAEATLGSIDVPDGAMKRDGAFWNKAALAGNTPLLTVAMDAIRIEKC